MANFNHIATASIADTLENSILDAKERGTLSPRSLYWILEVLQDQFDIPVKTIMPGCTTLESCAVSNHMVEDTVKIVRKELEWEKLPQDRIEAVLKEVRNQLENAMWKRIDILLNDGKSFDSSEYKADGKCHMVVMVPYYENQEPKYIVLDEYHNREGWMVKPWKD